MYIIGFIVLCLWFFGGAQIVADTNKTISANFDVLAGDYDYNDDGELFATGELVAYRGLFLIDKIHCGNV